MNFLKLTGLEEVKRKLTVFLLTIKRKEGYNMNKEYRIKETFGNHFEKRFSVQEKYVYYEHGNKIEAWKNVVNGSIEFCNECLNKYQNEKHN